ncbi:MAG: 50S ribosomal protein L19 [Azospirillum brasilense]|nr:MAG: 50S ribosomal protein L19 [Azospirillum brasilense]
MANIIEQLEAEQLEKVMKNTKVDAFKAGDVVRVNVKIIEGANERIQAFEGVVIAKKNAGLNSSFTVRKLSHGEGVERIFPLYSARIESVTRVRQGEVRRAKLYYLRGRTGKSARIREKLDLAAISAAKAEKAEKASEAKA